MRWPAEPVAPVPPAARGLPAALLAPFDRRAVDRLPRRQIRWIATSTAVGGLLGLTPLWATSPDLAVAVALGAGASVVEPSKAWFAPIGIALVALSSSVASGLGLAGIIGAGFAAGVVSTALVRDHRDSLDLVNGGLATLAGAAIGLWAATMLVPAGSALAALITTAFVSMLAVQGLVPTALRFDRRRRLPNARDVARTLRVAYRPPVFKAFELYQGCKPLALDPDSRRGLEEVAAWVFRLQLTLQARDQELATIDPQQIRYRIESHRTATPDADPSTRAPRAAAARHLERLLEHRAQIEIERARTEALGEYALAYLEEVRAGLALARDLPGDVMPEGLHEVLERLRGYADEGHARRKTERELTTL